jgi:hypothetical protein
MNRRLVQTALFASSALLIAVCVSIEPCRAFDSPPPTLGQQIKTAHVTAFARLIDTSNHPSIGTDEPLDATTESRKSRFQIVEVLKGQEILGDTREVELSYTGALPPQTLFWLQGWHDKELTWVVTWALNEHESHYLRQLAKLPERGCERMTFFLGHIRDDHILLADDARRELGSVSYRELKSLRDSLDSNQLIDCLSDVRMPERFRPLYLTLLSIAERPEPRIEVIEMLEAMLAAPADEQPSSILRSQITCYLTLKGPDGLPLIEDRFLKNKYCHFSETNAAVLALRFHGDEEQIIPKERLLIAFRLLLDRREVSDLVVPDLARAEDWSVLPRLVALAKDSDEKSYWVRTPVIQYLMACPLPEAAAAVEEFKQLDPEAVERANFLAARDASAKQPPTPSDDTTDKAPLDNPAPEDGTSGEGT